jgi:hypothetical protein
MRDPGFRHGVAFALISGAIGGLAYGSHCVTSARRVTVFRREAPACCILG